MGIQLGLTDSYRCQLPKGTDGTGKWKITVYAMGYADTVFEVNATDANIVKPEAGEADTTALKAAVEKAEALKKADYTADSWIAYKKALEAATKVAKDEKATKADLEKALADLQTAAAKLQKKAPEPETPSTDSKNPTVGTEAKVGKGIYRVTSAKKKTVVLVKPRKANNTSFNVPKSVKLANGRYKVVGIEKNAFKNNRKLKKVVIGSQVTKIGANAFSGAKNLKTITIKSKSLKSVGKNAFKGIHKNCKIKVPAKKLNSYKKLLSKKGQKASVKITK